MTQPQTLELVIDSMTAKGDGVAQHDGRTIYVRGAFPGETVQVVLEDEKPRYAQGRLLTGLDRQSGKGHKPAMVATSFRNMAKELNAHV